MSFNDDWLGIEGALGGLSSPERKGVTEKYWQQGKLDAALAVERGQQIRMAQSSAHYGNSLANANDRPKYGDTVLNPDRPLTGKPEHYLTRYEPSGKTISIPTEYVVIDMASKSDEFGYYTVKDGDTQPVDIKAFRKECEEIGE